MKARRSIPVFNSVPLYLRETLVFPYTEGGRFQNAVYEKMGKAAFAEVFTPSSRHDAADSAPAKILRSR